MARTILMDELHLAFRVPSTLPPAEYRAIHRSLHRPHFHTALAAAVRRLLARYPSLRSPLVQLSR